MDINLFSKAYMHKVIADFFNIDRIKRECQESSSSWHGYMVAVEEGEIVGCIGGACEDDIGFIYIFMSSQREKEME